MHFLETRDKKILSFINGNDETGFLHLYHYQMSLEEDNFTQLPNGMIWDENLKIQFV